MAIQGEHFKTSRSELATCFCWFLAWLMIWLRWWKQSSSETIWHYTAEKFQIQQRTSCFDTKCDAGELERLREHSRAHVSMYSITACFAECVHLNFMLSIVHICFTHIIKSVLGNGLLYRSIEGLILITVQQWHYVLPKSSKHKLMHTYNGVKLWCIFHFYQYYVHKRCMCNIQRC
jgi:hypothetical protein